MKSNGTIRNIEHIRITGLFDMYSSSFCFWGWKPDGSLGVVL
jgi:hypothetical protein